MHCIYVFIEMIRPAGAQPMKNIFHLFGFLNLAQREALLREIKAALSMMSLSGLSPCDSAPFLAVEIAKRCPCDVVALKQELITRFAQNNG